MVEEGSNSYSLAHDIVCREVDAQCACATCGLCCVHVNLANEGGVVVELEVEVEREIVADVLLLLLNLKHRVEVCNLVAGSDDE